MIYRLPQAVLENADKFPDNVAFKCGRDSLTYRQLATRIKQLAYVLKNEGIGRGDLVPVYLNRSIETAIALHGIMLAGAAFVPLNPKSPAEHIRFQIREVSARAIVTNRSQQRNLFVILAEDEALTEMITAIGAEGPESETPVKTVSWAEVAQAPDHYAGPARCLSSDVAYIMYTSGSTGKPKGITHTHRSGLGFARLFVDYFELDEHTRFGSHAPIYFDISTAAFFAVPLVGGTTVIVTDAHTIFPTSLSALIGQEQLTHWYSVPLALTQMLENGNLDEQDWSALRRVIYGGEPWAPKYIRKLYEYCPKLLVTNYYGPAEVNGCTGHTLTAPPKTDDPISIGDVWNDTDRIILDENDQELPGPGTGELLISSVTMMEGYYNRPDLTERAFYDGYQSSKAGSNRKFYRTGDRVKLDANGQLHFLGRIDHQLKIRGYRIEIDAIENHFLTHPDVIEAVMVAIPNEEGTKGLHGVFRLKPGSKVDATALLDFARAGILAYALPEKFHFLEQLPRTGSDKVDRNALALLVSELWLAQKTTKDTERP